MKRHATVVATEALMARVCASKRAAGEGFTLIELMVVVALLAVLATIAVPTFRTFIVEQRNRATMADLRIALMTARSEAVKRNRDVEVTASGGNWNQGWTIADPADASILLLNHIQSGSNDVTITASGGTVGFTAAGRVEGDVEKKFVVVAGSGAATKQRCLVLSASGRMDSRNKGDNGCP